MALYTSSTPGLIGGLSRPLKPIEREGLAHAAHLDRLKFFLAIAPSRWDDAAENAALTPSLNSMGENVDNLLEGQVTTPTIHVGYFLALSVPLIHPHNSTLRQLLPPLPPPQPTATPLHPSQLLNLSRIQSTHSSLIPEHPIIRLLTQITNMSLAFFGMVYTTFLERILSEHLSFDSRLDHSLSDQI
jgi:hypothetical protein